MVLVLFWKAVQTTVNKVYLLVYKTLKHKKKMQQFCPVATRGHQSAVINRTDLRGTESWWKRETWRTHINILHTQYIHFLFSHNTVLYVQHNTFVLAGHLCLSELLFSVFVRPPGHLSAPLACCWACPLSVKMMAPVFSSEQREKARGCTLNASQAGDKEQGQLSFVNTETQNSER